MFCSIGYGQNGLCQQNFRLKPIFQWQNSFPASLKHQAQHCILVQGFVRSSREGPALDRSIDARSSHQEPAEWIVSGGECLLAESHSIRGVGWEGLCHVSKQESRAPVVLIDCINWCCNNQLLWEDGCLLPDGGHLLSLMFQVSFWTTLTLIFS